jgi:N-acetylneuraminic acid mutarotase
MPTARDCGSTGVVNGKIYVIGGWLGVVPDGQPMRIVEEYDAIRDLWMEKTNMLTARSDLSSSVVDGKIYAIGGWIGGPVVSATEEYDPVADAWVKRANMPTARGMLSTSVVNGKIYAIGGYDGQRILSTVEEYDPAKDTWTKKADMPTARCWLSTSVVNNRIYAIGGGGDANKDIPLKTVEEYNPATDTWTRKADMPTARFGLATGVVNGKIYAIGGTTGYFNFDRAFSVVEIYDPAVDRWEVGSAMPTARAWLASGAVNGKIYAIGGIIPGFVKLATVEEYTPEGWPFSISPQVKLPTTWGEVKSE